MTRCPHLPGARLCIECQIDRAPDEFTPVVECPCCGLTGLSERIRDHDCQGGAHA